MNCPNEVIQGSLILYIFVGMLMIAGIFAVIGLGNAMWADIKQQRKIDRQG